MLVHRVVDHMPATWFAKGVIGHRGRIRSHVRRARERGADRGLDRDRQIRAMRQSSAGCLRGNREIPRRCIRCRSDEDGNGCSHGHSEWA